MSEFKNYKLFIYKNNQFKRVRPVIFENKDNIFDFYNYCPYIAKERDMKIL